MADNPIAGYAVYAQYGKESVAYGTEAASIAKPFGHDVRVSITPRNNLLNVPTLGNRNLAKMMAGKYEGILTVNFTLGNTHWLQYVMGDVQDGGSTPYTHGYGERDTLPSMTVEVGFDMGTTDVVRKFLGCKINTCTITCAVGEPVKVNLELIYKLEQTIGSTLDTTPATDTIAPMQFSMGTLEFPNATDISRVQNVELTIANNLISVHEIGSRVVGALTEGQRSYTGRVSATFENSTNFLTTFGTGKAIDVTEAADIELTIDNGETGSSQRQLLIRFDDLKLDTHGVNANPNELILEDVTFIAEEIRTMVGSDNTATA